MIFLTDGHTALLPDHDLSGWHYIPSHSNYGQGYGVYSPQEQQSVVLIPRDKRLLNIFRRNNHKKEESSSGGIFRGWFPKKSFGVHVTGK